MMLIKNKTKTKKICVRDMSYVIWNKKERKKKKHQNLKTEKKKTSKLKN